MSLEGGGSGKRRYVSHCLCRLLIDKSFGERVEKLEFQTLPKCREQSPALSHLLKALSLHGGNH
jgi:hypothetical protein